MAIALPDLPEPGSEGAAPLVTVAKHRMVPGRGDDLEPCMLADLAATRAEPEAEFRVTRRPYQVGNA